MLLFLALLGWSLATILFGMWGIERNEHEEYRQLYQELLDDHGARADREAGP